MPPEPFQTPLIRPEHPGKLLRQKLEERGWTQDVLADVTGLSRTTISAITSGRSGISAAVAVRLSAAFGNTAEEWLRWDADYQLSLIETDHQAVEKLAMLHQLAPVKEMQKRGWIRETSSADDLEAELTRFFGPSKTTGLAFPVATLRSDPLADLTPAEKAWCFRARRMAEALVHVAEFDSGRLTAAERKLRQLAAYPKEAERLSEILAYYGIRFVVVEPLPGTRIDGAAFWIDGSPTIAVSLRWDRIDAFWFTVMHEFMHIKHGDAYSADVNLVLDNDKGLSIAASDNETEQRASDGAANSLIPTTELDSFIKRVSPLYASTRIVQFAHRIKMHPGIIVGQLQHRGELRYSSHREFLAKVRKYVVETALTDGWGQSISPNVT